MLSLIIKKIHFPTMLFLGLLIGITATNIFHFSLEDYFSTNIISNIFFGEEYALSQSILLVSSVFYLLFGLLFIRCDKEVFKLTPFKKNFLLLIISAICLTIFIYICIVVYSYFSGKSEPYGLLRILITFFVLGCGSIAAYIRLNNKEELFYSKNIFLYDSCIILFFTISTAFLTLHFANPNDIKKHNDDRQQLSDIEEISQQVENFYIKNEKLPTSMKELEDKGYLKTFHIKLDQMELNVNSKNEYRICANFNHDFDDYKRKALKRINYGMDKMIYKKGLYCFKYQIKKNEKEKIQTVYLSGNLKLNINN